GRKRGRRGLQYTPAGRSAGPGRPAPFSDCRPPFTRGHTMSFRTRATVAAIAVLGLGSVALAQPQAPPRPYHGSYGNLFRPGGGAMVAPGGAYGGGYGGGPVRPSGTAGNGIPVGGGTGRP